MNKINYPKKPINSLNALCRALNVEQSNIADAIDNIWYRPVVLKKKDGTPRTTYDANPSLKKIQKSITKNILQKIDFPTYLHGCIKDAYAPRSIYTNASPHCGAKQIILCDIKDFFPSINSKIVFGVFRECLGFSPEVAKILTRLCTYNNTLPQGASPSSYIANLAFWDLEPSLREKLSSLGCEYSRFADDITISSKKVMKKETKTKSLELIRNTLQKKGCKLKRKKTMILRRGQTIKGYDPESLAAIHSPITITSLSAHHKDLSITKEERRKIRSRVHRLETAAQDLMSEADWDRQYASAMGRVTRLTSCGHKEGFAFKSRLRIARAKRKASRQRSTRLSGRK